MDRVPDGLSAFNGTVCVNGDTGAGAIAGIDSSLSLTVFGRSDRCLSFRVSDDTDAVGAGAESVVLGTLTLSETVPGTATITFDGLEPVLVDDEGARQVLEGAAGAFSVEPNATETVRIVLEDTPNGLYRYNLTVGASGPLGPLVGISSPARAKWLNGYRVTTGGIGARTVGLESIDFENETRSGSGELPLAELTYATDGHVNASDLLENLTVSVHTLRNDNGTIEGNGPVGDPIDPDRVIVSAGTTATCIEDAVSGSDSTISLTEIQTAINWWAEGTEVPDTGGETIDLTEIQNLINAWAEGTTVSCTT
ncbi:MAG: hypothetical protein ABEH66_02095 [Halobacteriales archaeon]